MTKSWYDWPIVPAIVLLLVVCPTKLHNKQPRFHTIQKDKPDGNNLSWKKRQFFIILYSQSLGTDVSYACLIFCLPSHSCTYKTSYPSVECAFGGRAERPQMVYANDNTSLIHQIKFRRNRYPWAHPLWFVEWSSTWWSIHLWPGLPK